MPDVLARMYYYGTSGVWYARACVRDLVVSIKPSACFGLDRPLIQLFRTYPFILNMPHAVLGSFRCSKQAIAYPINYIAPSRLGLIIEVLVDAGMAKRSS